MPVPTGCVCRSYNIPEDLDKKLREVADLRRTTMTALLVEALNNFLDKHESQARRRQQKEAA
jgi:predicted transcriptional regulator